MPISARRHPFLPIWSVWHLWLCSPKPCYKFRSRSPWTAGGMASPATIYGYCRDGYFRASFLIFCRKVPMTVRQHRFWLIQSVWHMWLCCSKPCYKFWSRIPWTAGGMAFAVPIYWTCRLGVFREFWGILVWFLPKNTYLGPQTSVLANSKCVAPMNVFSNAMQPPLLGIRLRNL